jgi:hypothetical protein
LLYPAHAVCRPSSRRIGRQRHTACAEYFLGRNAKRPATVVAGRLCDIVFLTLD